MIGYNMRRNIDDQWNVAMVIDVDSRPTMFGVLSVIVLIILAGLLYQISILIPRSMLLAVKNEFFILSVNRA